MRDYKPTDVSWDYCHTTRDLTPKERGVFLSNRNKALADLLEAAIAYIAEKVPAEVLHDDFHATITAPTEPVRDLESFAKAFDEESRSTVIGEAWCISTGGVRTAEQAAEYAAQQFDQMVDRHFEVIRPLLSAR